MWVSDGVAWAETQLVFALFENTCVIIGQYSLLKSLNVLQSWKNICWIIFSRNPAVYKQHCTKTQNICRVIGPRGIIMFFKWNEQRLRILGNIRVSFIYFEGPKNGKNYFVLQNNARARGWEWRQIIWETQNIRGTSLCPSNKTNKARVWHLRNLGDIWVSFIYFEGPKNGKIALSFRTLHVQVRVASNHLRDSKH